MHGDTYTTLNAKNICKPYFLPCKKCQSAKKSESGRNTPKYNKEFYYNRLTDYCKKHGGYVLENKWTKAKNIYHFKCKNPGHPVFESTADALYSGKHWCPYCSGRSGDFQNELLEICKSKNGELLSGYINARSCVTVKCKKHNYIWNIPPNNIKKGRWYPVCSMGFNEKVVWDYFKNMQCNVQIQYTFDGLAGQNNEKLKFDFAVFHYTGNLVYLAEVDDEEHKNRCFGNSPRQIQRQMAIQRDKIKDDYCKENNIPLYRMEVPFRNLDKWEYEDYYRYINAKLEFIANLSR